MPYENEFASHKSLHRIVNSKRVHELLGSYEVRGASEAGSLSLDWQAAPQSSWTPSYVFAVDGSHAEVKIENGFPGAEASYVTVASVLLDVAKMKQLDAKRPVEPKEFRKIEKADSIDCALPGCNVVCKGESSAAASLRFKLYEEFLHRESGGETLLETYQALLALKPAEKDQACPYAGDDCPDPTATYGRQNGCYECSCALKKPLYSTDALRIHEGFNLGGSNGALFAEVMQVWERVWIIHLLRTMEQRQMLSTLKRVAIVLDGPLAVFGHPAWLSSAIEKELMRLNIEIKKATGDDLLLIGIEKSGMFAAHLMELDMSSKGIPDQIEKRQVALLDDAYIKTNIQFSTSERPFGRQTYFGRKFFYKTRTGALIVGVLPHLSAGDDDLSRADLDQFPRLADALYLLDDLVCVRYPNSLSAIVAAHAEAAIPLHLGGNILTQLAKQLMGQNLDAGAESSV